MKALFLAFLFAKILVLTPEKVSFKGVYEIVPTEAMTVLNSGADLEINVTSMVPEEIFKKPFSSDDRIKSIFRPGSIVARLIDSAGSETTISYRGYAAISNNDVWLILDKEGGFVVDSEFVKVVINSDIALHDVQISWRNAGK